MEKVTTTPELAKLQEEAEWWDNRRDETFAMFQAAAKNGTLKTDSIAKRLGITPTTTIRLDPADIQLAKVQAEKRGLKYQTYLKMIIHQALAAEASKA